MVDTRRTLSALQTLLADNTTGDISPQDIRDMLLTLAPPYGGVSLTGNTTATTISGTGTDVVTNWNSTGAQTNVREFVVTTGGRITYTGTPTNHFHVVAQCSAYVTIAASKVITLSIVKNGTTPLPGVLSFTTQGSSDRTPVSCHTDVMLATNDYLELWVANETDTNNVVIYDAYLFAMGMIE